MSGVHTSLCTMGVGTPFALASLGARHPVFQNHNSKQQNRLRGGLSTTAGGGICSLSHDELDLLDFLEDQIASLQLVVKAQDTSASSMAQIPHALVQDSCPSQVLLLPTFAQASASNTRLPPLPWAGGLEDGCWWWQCCSASAPSAWPKATLSCNGSDLLFLRHPATSTPSHRCSLRSLFLRYSSQA
jgi:hypothetical protein